MKTLATLGIILIAIMVIIIFLGGALFFGGYFDKTDSKELE